MDEPGNSYQAQWIPTHVDGDLVAPFDEFIVVVAAVQFGERRKASSAHPVLKVLISVEVGRRVIRRVTIGILQCPVGRGDYLRKIITRRLGIFFRFVVPSDARRREGII